MKFFIAGTPRPQGRPRAFVRGNHAAVFSPTTEWKEAVKYAAMPLSKEVIINALHVDIEYLFPRPKSHYGTGKNARILKKKSPVLMIKKPDLDNLNKAVIDAMQDIQIYSDDSQIINLTSRKRYAVDGETPGAQVELFMFDEYGNKLNLVEVK
tara:strand:- start:4 stop:462 length:459 start_codon:yes stop_codon:yes gene_type:complete